MGAVLEKIFIDPSTFSVWPVPKVLFLMAVYGFVLFKASNLISDGSELLLLVPSLAGIVGSVVLPILGAVPDGMIVLFSGLGSLEEAREQLGVGVGALAGSTVMLLTLPWLMTLIAGRVDLDASGKGAYHRKHNKLASKGIASWHPTKTGTNLNPSVRLAAFIMIGTSITYVLIQGPAFFVGCSRADESCDHAKERPWAIAGFVFATLAFIGNLAYQVITANRQSIKERIDQAKHDAIQRSLISISGAFAEELFGASAVGEGEALINDGGGEARARFDVVLKDFFKRHDLDGNGTLDAAEMKSLLGELGERPSPAEFQAFMEDVDSNKDGVVQYNEFEAAMISFVRHRFQQDSKSAASEGPAEVHVQRHAEAKAKEGEGDAEEEEEEEEEEEVPDDLKHLTPKQQRIRVLWRACWMMLVGVALVIVFSDPMVDVLGALGKNIGVPPFYIAFVLAPLASNASELIASVAYAKKKTVRSSTISCESLVGAAIMNNTFCLGIFLLLVFVRRLSWEFSAETIAILFVELCMLVIAYFRTQRLFFGFIAILLYPASLGIVLILEKLGYN